MQRTLTAGALLAALLLAGCAEPAPSASGRAPAATPTPDAVEVLENKDGTTVTAPLDDHAAGVPEYHHGHPIEPPAQTAWDAGSRAAAVDAAVAAMTAFARPDLSWDQWWDELGPTMTVDAQVDYQYVDPINVPTRAVTGPGALVDDTSASAAQVEVPTDVGPYTVVVSRTDQGAPWLVERITPPDGVN